MPPFVRIPGGVTFNRELPTGRAEVSLIATRSDHAVGRHLLENNLSCGWHQPPTFCIPAVTSIQSAGDHVCGGGNSSRGLGARCFCP